MRTVRLAAALLAVLLCSSPAAARVVRVEITSRSVVLNGRPFGSSGAYEKIAGRVHFAVNPDDPANRGIVDLTGAPRDARGEVRFSADVFILVPRDRRKGNGALFLEVPNRGRQGIMSLVNGAKRSTDPSTDEEFGDGWLLRQGYTIAALGWQWDVGRIRP